MKEVKLLLERATSKLSAAKVLLREGYFDDAVSRAYYSMYFAARAILLIKNCFAENASQSSFSQKDLELLKKHFGVRVVDFVLCRRNLKGTSMTPFKMVKDVLNHLEEWTTRRQDNARFYSKALDCIDDDELETPQITKGRRHIFNQYTIRVKNGKRDNLKQFLEGHGISTALYYPLPLHLQPCFSFLDYKKGDFSSAEKASKEFLSLPVYPELEKEEREYVVGKICEFLECEG